MSSKRLLGCATRVALIAACLTVSLAATAQGSQWKILGTETSKTNEISFSTSKTLALSVPAKGTKITCSSVQLEKSKLTSETTATGVLSLAKCVTALNGVESKECTPAEPITTKVVDTLTEHGGAFYHSIKPAEGSVFFALKFHEACPLPDETLVEGFVVFKCTDAACGAKLATHTIEEASTELFSSGLKYQGHPASLVGPIQVQVSTTRRLGGKVDQTLTVARTVFGFPFEVKCQKMEFSDGLLFAGGTGQSKLLATECTTVVNKVIAGGCKPEEPIEGNVKFSLLPFEKGVGTRVSVSAVTGSTLATINIAEECASLPGPQALNGSLVLKCNTLFCEEEAVEHLLQLQSYSVTFGGAAATLGGSSTVSLGGGEEGEKWSGLG
jgi:hypothetical protein